MLSKLYKQDDYWHGKQMVGSCYSIDGVKGYYNDLRKKVLEIDSIDVEKFVPKVTNAGCSFLHPVTVCQVGLGAYDKFLFSGEGLYLRKAISCADWLCDHGIKVDCGLKWVVPYEFKLFGLKKGFHSGLIQGQAISLFVRLARYNQEYLRVAHMAYKFLTTTIDNGGCRLPGCHVYEEYPSATESIVLNGYISAIWGVWDLAKYTKDEAIENELRGSLQSLIAIIYRYDSLLWSRYSLKKNSLIYSNLASPYYHDEHIAQLKILVEWTSEPIFMEILGDWENKKLRVFNRNLVVLLKAVSVLFQYLLGKRV